MQERQQASYKIALLLLKVPSVVHPDTKSKMHLDLALDRRWNEDPLFFYLKSKFSLSDGGWPL